MSKRAVGKLASFPIPRRRVFVVVVVAAAAVITRRVPA
jgi:hypothetical protein